MAKAFRQSFVVVGAVAHLAHADRGSLPSRLDEDGKAQGGLDVGEGGRRAVAERHRAGGGNARLVEQPLGDVLVERVGRAGDPASGEWNAGHLGQPLHRPVLAVKAVQDRKDDVDLRHFIRRSVGRKRKKASVSAGQEAQLRAARRPCERTVLDVAQQPLPFACHVDRNGVVPLGRQRVHDVGRRKHGNLMLGRPASEQQSDAQPVRCGGHGCPFRRDAGVRFRPVARAGADPSSAIAARWGCRARRPVSRRRTFRRGRCAACNGRP